MYVLKRASLPKWAGLIWDLEGDLEDTKDGVVGTADLEDTKDDGVVGTADLEDTKDGVSVLQIREGLYGFMFIVCLIID